MDILNLAKQYGSIGAGGIAVVSLVYMMYFILTKIVPLLDSIKQASTIQTAIIQNNTDAIKEMSRSNDNVANALALLDNSFGSFTTLLEKHDERAESISIEIAKIGENTRNCSKNN